MHDQHYGRGADQPGKIARPVRHFRRAGRWRSKNTRSRQPFCGSARSFAQRVGVVRALVEKVVVDEKTIIVKVRPDALLNRDIPITRIGGPKRQHY